MPDRVQRRWTFASPPHSPAPPLPDTWFGRGIIYLLFGCLGLGTGDILRVSFSGIAIGFGIVWLLAACCMPHQPRPLCCDLTGDTPKDSAPSVGAAAPAAPAPAPAPFVNSSPKPDGNPFAEGGAQHGRGF